MLTTQLYFPDEPANRHDGLFRRDLEMRITEALRANRNLPKSRRCSKPIAGYWSPSGLMSRLLLTDEPPTPYCPHCGQPMKLVGISRLLGRSCPTLLELYCVSCDHEEIKEDRPTECVRQC